MQLSSSLDVYLQTGRKIHLRHGDLSGRKEKREITTLSAYFHAWLLNNKLTASTTSGLESYISLKAEKDYNDNPSLGIGWLRVIVCFVLFLLPG